MKKFIPPIIILIALVGVVAATSIKRVPAGYQALRLDSPDAEPLGEGLHFLPPFSGDLFVLPLGVFERRYPPEGEFDVMTADGLNARLAVGLRLRVKPGGERALHDTFGAAYEEKIADAVREAAEIEVARRQLAPGAELPDDFGKALADEVLATLRPAGLSVVAIRMGAWEVGGAGSGFVANVSARPLRKIIFVGIDGADWMIIDRLMAEGRLPNFKRFVEHGATGVLRSMEPMLSPLLWTTMATGKMPEDHGILNFTVFDEESGKRMPISRLYRKVDAFWNMLSDYNRTVDIIGWLATFPAEEINGVMVTDRVGYLAFADAAGAGGPAKGEISPESRADEMSRLIVNGTKVEYGEFKRFMDLTPDEFVKHRDMDFDPKDRINNMIMLYATAETFRNMSRHLLEKGAPDFLGVYYELVDATGHLFMHYAPPKLPDVSQEEFDKFKNTVDEAYVLQDEILGELMDACDDSTVIMMASDHGWKSGSLRPKLTPEIWAGQAAMWHRDQGIIGLYGNGIREGLRMDDAQLVDVAPTILALQGFPRVADMPGRVLTAAFDDSLKAVLSDEVVPTLQREREMNTDLAAAEAGDEEALKKLEALGYITPDNPFSHNNLGQRYMDQGELDKAIVEFQKAIELKPDFPSALNNLGACYGRTGQYDKAERVLRRALEVHPGDLYAINNLAVMFAELRQFDKALEWAQKAVEVEPNYANGRVTLGSIYATVGRFDDAQREFERALELDPENARAKANLKRLEQDRPRG